MLLLIYYVNTMYTYYTINIESFSYVVNNEYLKKK
jgi:hypothetical protein